ncbi:YjbF family lipoprotein [Dickeya sp. CFBP 2040]|uniref:YjbF family lipoprotein n=1 Tax=Dickeya sp. CFBP 2040 TaxID=2718531 RepID=UPI0014479145|nr:YjbF family lipoprotein [Dickeya sp. CFBP 2040]NKI76320.1 YjbF family lipoprotein [Dickeya sp. CFBP 2040]
MIRRRKSQQFIRTFWVFPFFSLLLSGCSQQQTLVRQMVGQAIWGQDNTSVTPEQVRRLPYASAYLKLGKIPQAFIVLAFAENHQLKWLSADKGIVTTSVGGRLIKTQDLGEDILQVENIEQDPLTLGLLKPGTPKQWHTRIYWRLVFRGGYDAQSRFERVGMETVTILDKPRQLVRFDEQVAFPSLGKAYTNHYWLDPENGQVIKSHQYMGPDMALVEFTLLKPYAQ